MMLFDLTSSIRRRQMPAGETTFGRRLAMAAATPDERRSARLWTDGDRQVTAAARSPSGFSPPRKHEGPAEAVAREARRLHDCSDPARAPSVRRIQDTLMLVAALSLSAGLGFVLVDLAARFALVAVRIAEVLPS